MVKSAHTRISPISENIILFDSSGARFTSIPMMSAISDACEIAAVMSMYVSVTVSRSENAWKKNDGCFFIMLSISVFIHSVHQQYRCEYNVAQYFPPLSMLNMVFIVLSIYSVFYLWHLFCASVVYPLCNIPYHCLLSYMICILSLTMSYNFCMLH